MIGNTVLKVLSETTKWNVFATIRNESSRYLFPMHVRDHIFSGIDLQNENSLLKILSKIQPQLIINCAGITKHKSESEDPLFSIPINSILPHRLARLCNLIEARLIHISTDCVFSGMKGLYHEFDYPDASDVYGKTKSLGEVYYPNTITLRTSTIGHELQSTYGLLDWFLSQQNQCNGYTKALFSGLPTVVFAQIIRDIVIPNNNLFGLYHIGSSPISKFDLLSLVANVYSKSINIVPDDTLVIDRSLSSERFKLATGYVAPSWPKLIDIMYSLK